ncbi:MAG TPA: lasso peptide biosynthesis B2 protein [Lentisphaeria bacterium]|nr:MAG: hypothetical protein A2X47_05615 [Lentisphaerae bacterium GWF2_38_69]HBM16130.1 lasso peptide biosynthesis B2 protein [Lentisphaeria bacterium]
MKVFIYTYKFSKLKNADKRLIIEAVVFLFIARMTILFLPYSVLKKLLGKHKHRNIVEPLDIRTIRKVANIIKIASDRLPWKCNCLPQAIAARHMLKKRNISSTLYLGMSKDKEKKIIAHAWLKAGNIPITGGRDNSEFTEVAYFG